ncbi:MAG: cobalamin-binding protein [Calditrichaeota bacterium]|nr:MAG: cobalamin-binding protein [Calditrichota bacterium]
MGHQIELTHPPRRIISLVPSQTELLFELGLDEEVVGITRYCIHPRDKCRKKTVVGGTKKFNFEVIEELQPDLIIGNKEENYPEGIKILQEKYPVWMSDVVNLQSALEMIAKVGELVQRIAEAQELAVMIKRKFSQLKFIPKIPVAYLIWKNPYMAVGGETFINNMLTHAGFINIFQSTPRYPQIELQDLKTARVILLSSEPYPFQDEDVKGITQMYPDKLVLQVDGTMFSWYGSRLQYMPSYFINLRRQIASSIPL